MKEKVSALISKVTVNSPVFQNEAFSPTLINYFFGKNGTGKSTAGNTQKAGGYRI